MYEFFKNKFDLLLVTLAFTIIFGIWIYLDFEVKLEPYVFALFGSWLTVLGLKPRPNQQTDIVAANIEKASTESGDVVLTPGTSMKTTKEI